MFVKKVARSVSMWIQKTGFSVRSALMDFMLLPLINLAWILLIVGMELLEILRIKRVMNRVGLLIKITLNIVFYRILLL